MRTRIVALGLLAMTLAGSGVAAAEPIVAQFWYAFGGKNREVTEEHIKRFNESQSKYRIEGAFQGDYFQAIAKIRAASVTKTAPPIFHVVGEFLPNLWKAGLLENLEPYAKGPNGTDLADFLPAQTQQGYFDYLGQRPAPLFALPFFRSTPILYYNADMLAAKGLHPPKTWDDLRAAARTLTVREGSEVKTYGFEVPVDWWFWYAMLHEAGGSLLSLGSATLRSSATWCPFGGINVRLPSGSRGPSRQPLWVLRWWCHRHFGPRCSKSLCPLIA